MKEIVGISNHNLIRNSNVFMLKGGKIDPEFQFSWIDDSYEERQQKFQLGYYFSDSRTNFVLNIECMLPTEDWYKILSYLNSVHDLINLLYISKFTRNYILTKLDRSIF